MEKVFPEPEYRLRLLPPEHPIWRAEQPVDPKYVRPLLGIDFGCLVYAASNTSTAIRLIFSLVGALSRS